MADWQYGLPEGYQVAFGPAGTARTEHSAFVTRWFLANDTLRLSGPLGEVYRLGWVPERRVFRDCTATAALPLFVFPRELSAGAVLSIACTHSGPDEVQSNAAVSCRLDVVPRASRVSERVEFRYYIVSHDGGRISGRYFRADAELFGSSLRLTSRSGPAYRFLRSTGVSLRGETGVDDGISTP